VLHVIRFKACVQSKGTRLNGCLTDFSCHRRRAKSRSRTG